MIHPIYTKSYQRREKEGTFLLNRALRTSYISNILYKLKHTYPGMELYNILVHKSLDKTTTVTYK